MIYEHTKSHFICLSCRRSFKKGLWRGQDKTCPECGATLLCLGKYFTTPPRRNEREWKKLEWMLANGWNGWNWPVRPQMTLLEVQAALREWRETIEQSSRTAHEKQSFVEAKRRASRRHKSNPEQARRELKRQQAYQERVLEEAANLQTEEKTP